MNRILSRGKVYKGKNLFVVAVVTFFGMILLLRQNAVREALNFSIKLCLSSIVPAVFPFMILSDFLIANISIKRESRVSRLFSKVTGINASGGLAFILGNICGFPIGAYISTELFENGNICEDEYKRLKTYLIIFMHENDVKDIEMHISDIKSAAKSNDTAGVVTAKNRLRLHIRQLRRLSTFSIEAIF